MATAELCLACDDRDSSGIEESLHDNKLVGTVFDMGESLFLPLPVAVLATQSCDLQY